MIQFFKKIRQGLISENKFSKYLLYAIGEIILVVVGIFIALQLNLWSENRKLDDVRQGYYQQVLDDLNKDTLYIEETIATLDSFRLDYTKYLETFKSPNLNPNQAFKNLFNLELSSRLIKFNSSAIETLESTGDIKLLAPHIRNKLADLKRDQDLAMKISFTNDLSKTEILQQVSLLVGSSTLSDRLINQADLNEFLKSEFNYPKIFLITEAVHEWKKVSEDQTLTSLNDLLIANNELQELISDALEE